MGSLFGRRREEGGGDHWYLCVNGGQWCVPCVYQCVNTELTVREPKTVEKRVEGEMGSKVTV